MTFISLAHARRQLAIDPKTLRRWLAQAHFAVLSHPSDHRLKGITERQLRELAQQHHRQLNPLLTDPFPLHPHKMTQKPTGFGKPMGENGHIYKYSYCWAFSTGRILPTLERAPQAI